jgi:predicted porin
MQHYVGFFTILTYKQSHSDAALGCVLRICCSMVRCQIYKARFLNIYGDLQMKKSLIALAALATVATVAQAQSSVTVYGLIDAGVRVDSNDTGTGQSQTQFANGVLATSRLGFRGTEDLGGGLKVNFNLETGLNVNNGAQSQTTNLFDRFAWVGVSDDKLGQVQMGRNTNAGVHIIGLINAHGAEFEGNAQSIGLGSNTRVNQVLSILGNTSVLGTTRSDNQVKYLNNFAGVNVVATYGLGGQAGDADKRKSTSFGVFTTISNVTLAAATFEAQDDDSRKLKYNSVGGNVVFGPTKFFAGYSKIEQDANYTRLNLSTATAYAQGVGGLGTTTENEGTVTNVGVQYTWNAKNTSALSYYDGEYKKVASGSKGDYKSYTFTHKYALSKRTTAYVSLDQGKIDGALITTQTDNKNTGYGVGVIHTF